MADAQRPIFYLYQMRSSGACFASNCRSNKELPTWPTLKGQIFICIKWGHLVPVLRLTAQVIKNCRHGRRSKANFLFVSNEIIRCLLCVWTTALPQYQWKRCAYFSRTTNSLFCLLVTRMAKVKKSGYIYFLHRLPSWLRTVSLPIEVFGEIFLVSKQHFSDTVTKSYLTIN